MISMLERSHVSSPQKAAEHPLVADTLRELRIAAGLTQEETARRVGLTLSGYRGYEQGKRAMRADQIPLFADAFGVQPVAITSRLWPDDPMGASTGLADELHAIGFRSDEAPLVAEIARDLARRSKNQRRKLLDILQSMMDVTTD